MLVASGLLSSLPSSTLARLSAISLMWHIVTILSTTLLVPMIAPYHQGPAFVWTKFYGVQYSSSGITSNLYLFMQVVVHHIVCRLLYLHSRCSVLP